MCRTRRRWIAACARLVRPGGLVVCSTINRNPKAYLFAIVGARIRAHVAAAGHARLRAPPEAGRDRRLRAARARLEARGPDRHDLQPARRGPTAWKPTRRSTTSRRFAAMPDGNQAREDAPKASRASVRAACRCAPYCSTSTARWPTPLRISATALNRVRADRRLPPLPVATLRPQASRWRARIVGSGLRHDAREQRRFRVAAAMHSSRTTQALSRRTRRLLRRAPSECWPRSSGGARLGHRDQQGGALHRAADRAAHALAARQCAVICGDTTPETKPHPAPHCSPAPQRWRPARHTASMSATPSAIVAGRAARACMYAVGRRVRLRRRRRNAGGMECRRRARSLPELLDWLPLAADIAAA